MNFLVNIPAFQHNGLIVTSAACLSFVTWTIWTVLSLVLVRPRSSELHPFELQRRDALREGNPIFRWLEPLVDEVERWVKQRKPESLARLQRSLAQVHGDIPWQATEFMATKCVEGGLVALGLGLLTLFVQPWTVALLVAATTAGGYGFLAEHLVRKEAESRTAVIRKRLPYAVDLIALMMQAGGGFQECLETFVDESQGHPLADQLRMVLDEIELGRPQPEALQAFNERIEDDDIAELVFAINKGEELGTPISAILRDQAEQMRLKRSQWGEKAAAEAGVKVIFPGMVIVVACLLAVLAPFALPIIKSLWL